MFDHSHLKTIKGTFSFPEFPEFVLACKTGFELTKMLKILKIMNLKEVHHLHLVPRGWQGCV